MGGQDRYRDFMLAARFYRHLTTVKRSGQRHGVMIPGRPAKDVTVPCLTCPIPGFNLPEGWEATPSHLRCVKSPSLCQADTKATSCSTRYLYRLILCADGN